MLVNVKNRGWMNKVFCCESTSTVNIEGGKQQRSFRTNEWGNSTTSRSLISYPKAHSVSEREESRVNEQGFLLRINKHGEYWRRGNARSFTANARSFRTNEWGNSTTSRSLISYPKAHSVSEREESRVNEQGFLLRINKHGEYWRRGNARSFTANARSFRTNEWGNSTTSRSLISYPKAHSVSEREESRVNEQGFLLRINKHGEYWRRGNARSFTANARSFRTNEWGNSTTSRSLISYPKAHSVSEREESRVNEQGFLLRINKHGEYWRRGNARSFTANARSFRTNEWGNSTTSRSLISYPKAHSVSEREESRVNEQGFLLRINKHGEYWRRGNARSFTANARSFRTNEWGNSTTSRSLISYPKAHSVSEREESRVNEQGFLLRINKHGEYWRRGNARSFTANARSFRTNEWGNSTTSRSLISYPKAHSVSEREESRVNEQGFLLRINKHGEYWRRGNARSFTANARSFRTNEWGNSTTSRSLISYPKAHSVSEREESRVNEQGFLLRINKHGEYWRRGNARSFTANARSFRTNEWGNSTTSRSLISYPKAHSVSEREESRVNEQGFLLRINKHGEYWRRGNARSFTANARSFRTNEWGNSTTSRSLISYPKAHSVSEREESRVNEQGFLLRINKHGEYWRRGNARSFTANARSFRTNEWGNSTTSRSLISYPKAHSVSEREESRVNEQGFLLRINKHGEYWRRGNARSFTANARSFRTNEWGNSTTSRSLISYPKAHSVSEREESRVNEQGFLLRINKHGEYWRRGNARSFTANARSFRTNEWGNSTTSRSLISYPKAHSVSEREESRVNEQGFLLRINKHGEYWRRGNARSFTANARSFRTNEWGNSTTSRSLISYPKAHSVSEREESRVNEQGFLLRINKHGEYWRRGNARSFTANARSFRTNEWGNSTTSRSLISYPKAHSVSEREESRVNEQGFLLRINKHGEYWRRGNARSFTANARSFRTNEWGNSTTSRSLISYPKAHSVSEREESRVNEQGFLLRINKHGEYWRRGNARSFTANARSFRTNEWGNSTTSRSLISYPKAHSVSEREESRVNEQGFLLRINKHGEYWRRGNARSFTANARSFRTNEWGNSTTSRSLISYPKAHSVSEREESRVNEQGFLLRINKHGEYWRRGNARSFTANARSFRTNEWGNSTTSRSLISYPKAHSVSEREESRVNEQGFLLRINKHGEYWRRGNARSFTANARSFRTNEWGNSTTSRSLISYPKAHSVSEREESRVNEQGFLLRINKHGEYWRRGNARSFTANARSFRTNEWGNSTTSRSLISYPKAHSVSEREESRVNEQGFLLRINKHGEYWRRGNARSFTANARSFRTNEWGNSTTSRSLISYPKAHSVSEREESRVNEQGFLLRINKHGEYWRRGNARSFTANARSFRTNEWGNSTTSRSLISYPKAHSVSEREESRVNEQGFLLRINKHGEYWRRGNARSFTANARSFRTNEWGNSTTSRSLISYPKAHSVSEREESRVNEQGFLLRINKHGEYWRRGNARSFTANARSFRTNEWGNSTTSRSLISYPKAHSVSEREESRVNEQGFCCESTSTVNIEGGETQGVLQANARSLGKRVREHIIYLWQN